VFAKNFQYFITLSLLFVANVWTMDDLIFHGLPIIKINTENRAPIQDKVNYIPMQFILTDPNNPENNVSLIAEDFSDGGIRGRGNMTWTYAKQPYRIKFNKKTSLFGLEKAKSWVLLAEYLDPTYLTTPTAFHLGDIFGMRFNHSYHHVELYLNEEYLGIYGLTEQNQVGKGRVDIDEIEGWFVEMDANYDEEPKFTTTNYNLPIMIKTPEFEPTDINNPAFDFVYKDINELCDSIASLNFPENGYRDLIDMDNFIDYLMVNEIVMNHELAWPKSTYSYKDKNGKINMGPLWDFDWAYSSEGTHIFFQTYNNFSFEYGSIFFYRFFQDPIFLVKYKERWNEKYNEILDVLNFINELSEKIKIPFAEDYERWKYYYGNIYPQNYIEEINRMKIWYNNRISQLNTNLNKVEILPKDKTFTNQIYGYSEITPQTFTLVAYSDMTELSVTLKNGNLSGFEILRNWIKIKSTGNGGYLVTINVKPKNALPAAVHTDTLILSGKNQEKNFVIKAPLNFVVNASETIDLSSNLPQIATGNFRYYQHSNAIVLENIPKNTKVETYNLQGKLIYSKNSKNSQILRIPIQTKGIYFIKFGNQENRSSDNILRIIAM